MGFIKYTMDRFVDAYTKVFKRKPVVEKIRDEFYLIQGMGNAYSKTLLSAATYYNWCIKNNKDAINPDEETLDVIDKWLKGKLISRVSVSFIFGFNRNSFAHNYRNFGDIKKAYNVTLSGTNSGISQHTWDGLTLSRKEWSSILGMSYENFNIRMRKHGPNCYLTFLHVTDYAKIDKSIIKKLTLDSFISSKEDEDISNNISEKIEKEKYTVSYKQAVLLVQEMINDAKINLVKGNKKYFRSSQLFLMNSGDSLKFLIEPIRGINLDLSMKELHYFATEGYKKYKFSSGKIVKM